MSVVPSGACRLIKRAGSYISTSDTADACVGRRRLAEKGANRQTRQLPRAVDLKGRLLSCQSY